MSHGDIDKIHCYEEDYRLEELSSLFTDENCPSLIGKPRIFLVQACRHRSTDLLSGEDDFIDATPDEKIVKTVIDPPNHKDFIFVRSTMAGFYSFRHPLGGSWFIQDLCVELEENGTVYEFLHLLTRVSQRMAQREVCLHSINQTKQTLSVSFMLTKIIRFNTPRICNDSESF